MRKVKYFSVTPECILDMLTKTHKVEIEGIPEDCEFVDVYYSMHGRYFNITVRHPSFPILAEGCEMERINDILITVIE